MKTLSVIKKTVAALVGASLLFCATMQTSSAVIYVQPTSCKYNPTYNYIKCYHHGVYRTFPATSVTRKCTRLGVCYYVRCYNYPFYNACYHYTKNPNPNRLY